MCCVGAFPPSDLLMACFSERVCRRLNHWGVNEEQHEWCESEPFPSESTLLCKHIFFFSPLNNKDNQKKHLQEAQKAYCWRAGISLPWLSQSRRAVLAEDGAGWLCPDPFQNWMKFHKGTIRSANVPSFSGEIWPYLLGFLPWSSCAINSPLLSTWAWDSFHLPSHLGATSLAADLTCKVFHPCRYQSLDPALLNWSLWWK